MFELHVVLAEWVCFYERSHAYFRAIEEDFGAGHDFAESGIHPRSIFLYYRSELSIFLNIWSEGDQLTMVADYFPPSDVQVQPSQLSTFRTARVYPPVSRISFIWHPCGPWMVFVSP